MTPDLTPDQYAALGRRATDDWPIAKLTGLCLAWIDGESTSKIGIRVGATKNAVVGKAHRLIDWGILEGRPSPIGFKGVRQPKPVRAPAVTLPPLASPAQRPPTFSPRPAQPRFDQIPRPVPAPYKPPSLPLTATCRYPLWGDQDKPSHCYCDAPTPLGESWCADCRKRVFHRVRDQFVETAA